jgi:hypothetical protein
MRGAAEGASPIEEDGQVAGRAGSGPPDFTASGQPAGAAAGRQTRNMYMPASSSAINTMPIFEYRRKAL